LIDWRSCRRWRASVISDAPRADLPRAIPPGDVEERSLRRSRDGDLVRAGPSWAELPLCLLTPDMQNRRIIDACCGRSAPTRRVNDHAAHGIDRRSEAIRGGLIDVAQLDARSGRRRPLFFVQHAL
jgi:hypothetical protein